MTVSQRLYLAVVPAILGVFLVAALAYWAKAGTRAPHVLLLIGVVTSLGSLAVAWHNTRYVAGRVSRLAAPAHITQVDELDTIEGEVERLRRALTDAIAAQSRAQASADQRVREYAELIGDAAAAVTRQLDEVRIPLHILLESHFGDLNENQEEMLEAARAAADDVHTRLDRLRAISEVDRGALRLRAERVRIGDIVNMLMPGLAASAAHGSVTVDSDISPLQPAVLADRAWLSEALALLAADAVRRTRPGGHVRLASVEPEPSSPPAADGAGARATRPEAGRQVQIVISHGEEPGRPIDVAFADRLIGAQGGHVHHEANQTSITLPADPASRATATGTGLRGAPVDKGDAPTR